MRGKHDIPPGVTRDDLRQHLFVTFVGGVTDTHAALPFETREHRRIDVSRPVENVQAGPAIAGAGTGERCGKENPAVHRVCSLWETRIMAPKATTMSADTALTTGLTPRRAMA